MNPGVRVLLISFGWAILTMLVLVLLWGAFKLMGAEAPSADTIIILEAIYISHLLAYMYFPHDDYDDD